mmetsp:Transcript_11324/g.28640  ORF Transcript_11324/g.28640 Transcript_11324/m.28640 type:complete len:363 (+) Transcript_11324:297-1385(+)
MDKGNQAGAHNSQRARLSKTCRRLNSYFFHHYVSQYTDVIDFETVGLMLKCFPRVTTVLKCQSSHLKPSNVKGDYIWVTDLCFSFFGNAYLLGTALCNLVLACPLLKRLEVTLKGSTPVSLLRLNGASALPHLEDLELHYTVVKKREMIQLFTGRTKSRNLYVSNITRFYDRDVLKALPSSIESLCVEVIPCNFEEALAIIGRLPNLNKLTLDYERRAGWLGLQQAAARLTNLTICYSDVEHESISSVIPSLVNLKSLEFSCCFGDCEDLMCAISSLQKIETLKMTTNHEGTGLNLKSDKGLLHIRTGPVRHSLMYCEISLTSEKRLLGTSLSMYFRTLVVPSLANQKVAGFWFDVSPGGDL